MTQTTLSKPPPTDYSTMTQDDFAEHLHKVVSRMSTAELLAVPGVFEVLSEEMNNDVLDSWAADNVQ